MILVENGHEKQTGKKQDFAKGGEAGAKERQKNGHEGKDRGDKEKYEMQIAELKSIAEEYKQTLQRLQAEFENAGKRREREKDEFMKFAAMKTIEEFLPIADSIEEGMRQAEKSGNAEMKSGFELLGKQFTQVLARNGVRQIETTGKKFDHGLHEALMTGKEGSEEDDVVLEEFRKGYTINGKVLRPAKVKVNKKP